MIRKLAAAWRAFRIRLRAGRVWVRQACCSHRGAQFHGVQMSPVGPIAVRGCVRCKAERIGLGSGK